MTSDDEQHRLLIETLNRLTTTLGGTATDMGLLSTASRRAATDITEAEKKLQTRVKALDDTLSKLGSTTLGLVETMAKSRQQVGINDATKVVTGGMSAAGDAAKALGSTFGRAGKIIGVVAEKLFKSLGWVGNQVSEQMVKNLDMFREAAKTGTLRTIEELHEGAKKTNLLYGEYSKMLGEHSAAFGQYAGSAVEGRKQFEALVEQSGEVTDKLKMLGMSSEEIVNAQARMYTNMGKFGMSVREITSGARDYLMNLEELSKITGKAKVQLQKEEEERSLDARLQLKVSAPGAAISGEKYSKMEALLSPGQQKLLRDIFVHEGLPVTDNIKQLLLAGGNPYDIYSAAISGDERRLQQLMNQASAKQFGFGAQIMGPGVSRAVSGRHLNEQMIAEAPGMRNRQVTTTAEQRGISEAVATDPMNKLRDVVQIETKIRETQMKIEEAAWKATEKLTGTMELLIGGVAGLIGGAIGLMTSIGTLTAVLGGVGAAGALGGAMGGRGGAAGGSGGGSGGSGGGRAAWLGRFGRYVPFVGGAVTAGSTYAATGSIGRTIANTVGSIGGGIAGGALGTVAGPVGTVAGGAAGAAGGAALADSLYGKFFGGDQQTPAASGSMREIAEQYLGRRMTDNEFNALVKATHAEAGPRSKKELALIMGSILNRARGLPGEGVLTALYAKNQFQSVTGVPGDRRPSRNFEQGPSPTRAKEMEEAAAQYLMSVSKNQRDFTAADPRAYGAGTNIGYLHKMSAMGGQIHGGSMFNAGFSGKVGEAGPIGPAPSGSSASRPSAAGASQTPTSYAASALASGGGVSAGGWGRPTSRATAAESSANTPPASSAASSSATSSTTAASVTETTASTTQATTTSEAGPAKLLSDLNTKMAEMVDLTKKLLNVQGRTLHATRNA